MWIIFHKNWDQKRISMVVHSLSEPPFFWLFAWILFKAVARRLKMPEIKREQLLKHALTPEFPPDSHVEVLNGSYRGWRFVERLFKSKEVTMESTAPCVYINDDEIELRQIIINCGDLKKQRKFTVSEAEKRGLVRVELRPNTLRKNKFSKSITILNKSVKLCLSTKAFW